MAITEPAASIIVRCFNEERHIGKLFDALATQTFREFEVVVVDSGSTDRTLEMVKKSGARLATIRPEEFTFGASLNRGCSLATGRILVMISAHAYPMDRTWLERLVGGFSREEVGIVYGAQRGGETTKFSETQVFRKWYPDDSSHRRRGAFCNNANCAVRTSLWKELSYNEDLTGLEDIDFAVRAMREGVEIVYLPEAMIAHVHDETTNQTMNRYRREAIALQGIYPYEHFSLWDFLRLYIANVTSDLREASRIGVLGREWKSILCFRWAQFWGTYRGFHQRRPVDSELKRHLYYPNGEG